MNLNQLKIALLTFILCWAISLTFIAKQFTHVYEVLILQNESIMFLGQAVTAVTRRRR